MLLGYEYTSRNRCESGLTFSMGYADELLSPKVCKIGRGLFPTFDEKLDKTAGDKLEG